MIRVTYCYPYSQTEQREKFFRTRDEAELWLALVGPYLWNYRINDYSR